MQIRKPLVRIFSSLLLVLGLTVGFAVNPVHADPPLCSAGTVNGISAVNPLMATTFPLGDTANYLANYLGYEIVTTTGAPTDLKIKLTNFQSVGGGAAVVNLVNTQADSKTFTGITAGNSYYAYFLATAAAPTNTGQVHTYTISDGSTDICTGTFTYTQVIAKSSTPSVTAAAANKVTNISVPAIAGDAVGSTATVVVTGDAGTLPSDANGKAYWYYTPIASATFPADTWELSSTLLEMPLTTTHPAYTITNKLFAYLNSTTQGGYTATYTFKRLKGSTGSAAITPISYIASGNLLKFTGSLPTGGALGALPAGATYIITTKAVGATVSGVTGTGTVSNPGGSTTGSGTVDSPYSTTVISGGSITSTATATGGSVFTGWTCAAPYAGLNTTNSTITITPVTAAGSCQANFDPPPAAPAGGSYTVVVSTSGNGTGTVSVGGANTKTTAENFTSVATATGGSTFNGWTCTPITPTNFSTANATLTVTGAAELSTKIFTCVANFTKSYTVTTSTSGSGSVSNPGANSVPSGNSFTSVATATAGYQFDGWTCTPNSYSTTNATLSIANVTESVTCTASFSAVAGGPYNITTTTSGNGSGTLSVGPSVVSTASGDSFTSIATADAGSTFAGWTCTPDSYSTTDPTLYIEVVTEVVTCDAKFTKNPTGGGGGRFNNPNNNNPTPPAPTTPPTPPAPPTPGGSFTPTGPGNTQVNLDPPPPGGKTEVLINGKSACETTTGSCALPALLGPKAKIEAVTTNPDGTKSRVVLPAYAPEKPIPALVVYFNLASSKLTKKEIAKLDNFVKLMKEQGFTRVVLQGHTDVQGTVKGYDNKTLSKNRANVVADYLSKFLKVKVAKDQFADTKPAVEGDGEQVYKNNRRTEVLVW